LVVVVIPVVAMVSKAVRETHAKLTKHINRLVGRRMSQAYMAKVEVFLDLVEHFAMDNPTINFHLHMSGYDLGGKVFWVPIFEDQVVLDSPAKRVLNMVYRYIESTDSMLVGSTKLLEGKTWRAAAKHPSCNKSVPRGLPPAASNLTASSTAPATGAPSTGGAPPPSTLTDPHGADDDNAGPDVARTDDDADTDNSASDTDDDILSKAGHTGGRNRRSAKTCPETATPPLTVIPSQSSKNVVMAFLTASTKPLTLMRTLVPAMAKSVCSGASVAKSRVSRAWWPKTDKGKLWQQTVEVDHVLLRAADKAKGPTDGETMVSLRRMLAKRSARALERVADMLLMVEREPKAKATLIKFSLRLQRTQLRRTVSIAPMSGISIAGKYPAGQGEPSVPSGLDLQAAPTGQGRTSAPAPAAVPFFQAARPSLDVAAAAGGGPQGSAPHVGFGQHAATFPQGERAAASAFDQTRVREALAAAAASVQESAAAGTAAESTEVTRTGLESTRAESTRAAGTRAIVSGAASTGADSSRAERTAAAVTVSEKKAAAKSAAAPTAAANTAAAKASAVPTAPVRSSAARNGAASTRATSTGAPRTAAESVAAERRVAVSAAGANKGAASTTRAMKEAAKAAPAMAAVAKAAPVMATVAKVAPVMAVVARRTAMRPAVAALTAPKTVVARVAAAKSDGTSPPTPGGSAASTAVVYSAAVVAPEKQPCPAAQSSTLRLPLSTAPALTPRPPPLPLPTPVAPNYTWAQLSPTAK